MSHRPANRVLAALLSEHGRVVDGVAQSHVEATDHTELHDLHRHDDDGGPGCPHDRRAAQEEARKLAADKDWPAPLYLEGNTSDLGGEALPEAVSKSHHDTILPTGYDERKSIPIATGLLDYFPKACAAVAIVSRIGNDQHNPGEPLHWARGKSMDQDNTAIRHFLERGGFDTDGARHTAKAAWRLLARLELEIEADGLGLERKVS